MNSDREMLRVVPIQPTEAMLDRAVAFALNVSLSRDYNWSAYMRDLWARFLDEPETVADLTARARWHQQQASKCYRKIGEAP